MSSLAKLVFHGLTTARIMKMGARSRYANRADVSVSVAITQRGVTGISRLSLAPLVGTRRSVDDHAQPYSRGREWCASQACAQCHLCPWPLTQAFPTLQHFIFEGTIPYLSLA